MYYLHIERLEDNVAISREEWEDYTKTDPEIEYTNTVSYTSPNGEDITRGGGFYGKWEPKGKECTYWFTYEDGVISVIYDSLSLKKCHHISNTLNANVIGDMGEEL